MNESSDDPKLVAYRVREVERRLDNQEKRLETLATKDDVAKIERKLDQAASLKASSQLSWQTVLLGGGAIAVFTVIVQIIAQAATGHH